MNGAAVDSLLENKHGSALRVLGVFLDDHRRTGPCEELIHRESIIKESIVAVLGYPDVPDSDQGGKLLPEAGHHALSAFSVLPHNAQHHGVAGVAIDFKTDCPPPLPCRRWFGCFLFIQYALRINRQKLRALELLSGRCWQIIERSTHDCHVRVLACQAKYRLQVRSLFRLTNYGSRGGRRHLFDLGH